MSHTYIFSGLGADESVFQRLEFAAHSTTFVTWIVPHLNESIEKYATRLLSQIKTSNPILIGLSFGGLIAIEVAKQIATEKVIILASVKHKNELPFYYRIAGKIGLHKIIPTKLFKNSNWITYWLFGTSTSFEKNLLKQILINTDTMFMKWAIDQLVHWDNVTVPINIIHIHGTSDKILPIQFVKCTHVIENGGHFMTINKAKEVNALFQLLLSH